MEKPPLHFEHIEGFAKVLKNEQAGFGENKFSLQEPTADLIKIISNSLKEYFLSNGQEILVLNQMLQGVRKLF